MHPIINKIIYKFNHQQKYALALKLIEDFISSPGHYFPITTSSLDVHSLACVINDIIINERKKYVEFGSGISTIAIARLIKANNLKTHIYSVEDNGEWLNIMKKYLQKEGLLDTVTFLHCPLERSKFSKQGNNWYSEKV